MAYVNVADWKAEQVAEWLKGLDGVVLQYIRLFVEKNVNGQELLDLQPNDLEDIGITKIGHQEIILEAIDLLKNFYYDLDRENLQLLALRLSCLSRSLLSELRINHMNSSVVSTQVLADVANVVSAVKPLVCWLDRTPFCDQLSYVDKKTELSKLSVEMAMSGMRDKFAEKPIDNIRQSCKQLADLADTFIQGIDDSLLLQPASLDLATLKKRPGDHLGFYIVPSFHGMLQVGELKCNSAAHQCGKVETGDEIVQINYQTVVGWEVKEVMSLLFEESSTEVLMTLKKRPRHSKVFGQIYIKPYRLPCKKQMSYSNKWIDLLSPSRPELLSVPAHFGWPFRTITVKQPTITVMENPETKPPPSPTPSTVSSASSRSSESDILVGPSSPNSVRLYLPKPRMPVQRRATITGASPVSKHAPLSLEQFWHELKLEREWRSNSDEKTEKASSETQLKRSAPTSHCSLNWSTRFCEQNSDSSKSNISVPPNKGNLDKDQTSEENGIIPLKQRIDCLNRAIEQTAQKPKLLPKPLLPSKPPKSDTSKSPFPLSSTPKEMGISSRRERGKLDKSYSTPSYDYSVDSKEPLMFNMKLPEEKVKSAPDNITSEFEHRSEFKKLELESPEVEQQHKTTSSKLEQINEHDYRSSVGEQSTCNEYLEIKTEEISVSKQDAAEKENGISDSIELSKIENESSLTKEGARNIVPSKLPNYFTFEHSTIMPYTSTSSKLDTDSLKTEDMSSISDTLRSNVSDASQPIERLHIHTTINVNVPATFPRHKMESKKGFLPPEPPPRPAKGSSLHSKFSKSSAVAKASVKSPPHKSPKVTRKKNVWLTKRRNVSVKDLGVCEHEGWLYHRSRKMARGSPQWIKGWFIIKGTIFYGFNTREATHARLMISLPGFTVSPAEEVKSRNFSFKVYHTGTTFYFAAESGEDLHGWVESFSRVTVSDEEQSIVVSETDGEEEDEPQTTKKDKSSGESSSSHLAAMKKLSGLITGHLSGMQDSKSGDKKFNSLKKVSSSRKASKEDQQHDNSHIASLDRKYLKFFSGSRTQNFNPVPTAQFRSYRRVPPMEKPPFGTPESNLSNDLSKADSLPVVSVPSTSPTRPPDMADYRLASLAKCPNPRTQESAHPGGSMTLESFMLTRQEEERRHQSQHPRATNILRVPQCQAPPPPTPPILHNVAAATGHESSSFHPLSRPPAGPSTSTGKSWSEHSSLTHKFGDSSSMHDMRPKHLKKTTQYQPPPWDPPVHRINEDIRLQPAFEMTLDRQPANENIAGSNKIKKTDISSSSSLRFKNLFSTSKTDTQKANLISSPRLRRVLFRDKKSFNQAISPTGSNYDDTATVNSFNTVPLIATHPQDTQLPNAPDYPGLQYPPIFEPGSYSLSDVSNLLRSSRVRSFDNGDDTMSNSENFDLGLEQRMADSVHNVDDHDRNENEIAYEDDQNGPSFANV